MRVISHFLERDQVISVLERQAEIEWNNQSSGGDILRSQRVDTQHNTLPFDRRRQGQVHVVEMHAMGGIDIVDSRRDVDGCLHSDLLAGIELGPQQVEVEMRVGLTDRGRVVAPAMVAFGEKGDRVDVARLQGLLPFPAIEPGADPGDLWGGVKIEMDLAETEVLSFGHGILLG